MAEESDRENVKRRINGLSPPLNRMQLLTWVFFSVLFIQYLALVAPHHLLSSTLRILFTIVFVISGICTAYFVYRTCSIDSIDELLNQKIQRDLGFPEAMVNSEFPPVPDGNTKFCWVCQTRVHELSMHCKYCQKCVSRFDHHCQWLNTCVGRHNYPYFVNTLYSIIIFCAMNFVGCLIIVINFWTGSGKGYYGDGGSSMGGMVIIIVLMLFILLLAICLLLIGQLLLFHMKLKRERITTYEFIVRDNHKKRELSSMRYNLAQSGAISMWQLELGKRGCLPIYMDPARKKVLEQKKREEDQERLEKLRCAAEHVHDGSSISTAGEKKTDDIHILPVASTADSSKHDYDERYLVNKKVDVELAAVVLNDGDQSDEQEVSLQQNDDASNFKQKGTTSFLAMPETEERNGINGKEKRVVSPKNNVIAALGSELDRFTAEERLQARITLSPTISSLDQSKSSIR